MTDVLAVHLPAARYPRAPLQRLRPLDDRVEQSRGGRQLRSEICALPIHAAMATSMVKPGLTIDVAIAAYDFLSDGQSVESLSRAMASVDSDGQSVVEQPLEQVAEDQLLPRRARAFPGLATGNDSISEASCARGEGIPCQGRWPWTEPQAVEAVSLCVATKPRRCLEFVG